MRFGGTVADVADGWLVGRFEAELRGDSIGADVGVAFGPGGAVVGVGVGGDTDLPGCGC